MKIRRLMIAVASIAFLLFLCDNWQTSSFTGAFPLKVLVEYHRPDPIEWVFVSSAHGAEDVGRFVEAAQDWKPEPGGPVDPLFGETDFIKAARFAAAEAVIVYVLEAGTQTALGRTISYSHNKHLTVAVRRQSGAFEAKSLTIPDFRKSRRIKVSFP